MSERPTLENRVTALEMRWQEYLDRGSFEHFVEFALALNCLTEQFSRLKLPGLVRLCEGLENTSLALFGDHGPGAQMILTDRRDGLLGSFGDFGGKRG